MFSLDEPCRMSALSGNGCLPWSVWTSRSVWTSSDCRAGVSDLSTRARGKTNCDRITEKLRVGLVDVATESHDRKSQWKNGFGDEFDHLEMTAVEMADLSVMKIFGEEEEVEIACGLYNGPGSVGKVQRVSAEFVRFMLFCCHGHPKVKVE